MNPKHKLKIEKGHKFARLTIIKEVSKSKFGERRFLCICICGNTKEIQLNHLRSKRIKSCGCLEKENLKQLHKNITIHSMAGSRFHNIWGGMKQRCRNPRDINFDRYGGRGIKVCNRWSIFINFKDDMLESYLAHVKIFGKKQTTIDRRNNDGNYCKKNCKWATYKEQANNTSRNIKEKEKNR